MKYVDKEFGIFGTGVSLYKTAEESAEDSRNREFNLDARAENYSDLYRWRSRNHPEFEEFSGWYSSGDKVWPQNIKITPTVLKHWYCGDGSRKNRGTSNCIVIGMTNEVDNTDKVSKLFESAELPSPSNYNIYGEEGQKNCIAEFSVSQSKELWEYMGEPLPGFEYKWPEEYRNTY